MSKLSVCLVMLALWVLATVPTAAQSQEGCGCQMFPMEGRYDFGQGGFLLLSYRGDAADRCPSQIDIFAPRGSDANDASVILNCMGGTWQGTESTMFDGRPFNFEWLIQGAGNYDAPPQGSTNPEVFANASYAVDQIYIELQGDMMVGNRLITRTGTLAGTGRAPSCQCAAVREAREDAQIFLDQFSDPAILRQALATNAGSNQHGLSEHIDDNNVYHPRAPSPTGKSYQQLVSDAANKVISETDAPPSYMRLSANAQGRLASVDAITCEITPPEAAENSCVPPVMLSAVLAHENVHVRQCQEGQRAPFKLSDGRTVYPQGDGDDPDWPFGEDMTTEEFTGYPVDRRTGITIIPHQVNQLRSRHPSNLSAKEIEAHQVEIAEYDRFLDTYCQ
ncbi:MAG: hypothetical protein HRT60_06505 [Dinoroseobacter sp.]|nr:hypothetical protein [Dinoroseobacter sp.]